MRNSTTVSYTYDATNQLLTDGSNTLTFDAAGNRTNGSNTTTTGNQLHTDGTWTYTYDNEGNETYKVKSGGENWTYTYDNKNDVTQADHRASVGGAIDLTATYVYDALGNRIEKDVTQSGTTTVTKSIRDWVSCNPAIDESAQLEQALYSAANHFTLVVDCPVRIHTGAAALRSIAVPDGVTVQFQGAGEFLAVSNGPPALTIANPAQVSFFDWNLNYL